MFIAPPELPLLLDDEAEEVPLDDVEWLPVDVGVSWAVGVVTGSCELTPATPQNPAEY